MTLFLTKVPLFPGLIYDLQFLFTLEGFYFHFQAVLLLLKSRRFHAWTYLNPPLRPLFYPRTKAIYQE